MANSTQLPVSYEDTVKAHKALRPAIEVTPLTFSRRMSEIAGHDVFIKWESSLTTGSFKERGALNFLLDLNKGQPVCAASAGNHALGLAFHSRRLGHPCYLIMPKSAPLVKVQQARGFGAEVILHGNSYDDAREYVLSFAEERGLPFVPAYDDAAVIAGQGSIAHELVDQLPDLDSIIVPVGGGGIISGISIVLRERLPKTFIMGVRSQWVTKKLYQVDGKSLLPPASLADGIAVKTFGKVTEGIVKANVDALTDVSESEVANAMMQFLELEHSVVEGSGAVGFTPLFRKELPAHCKRTVVIMSGSNVDLNVVSRLINREMVHRSRLVKLLLSVPDQPGCLHILSGTIAEDGANIVEIIFDRFFSASPGNVEVTIVIEVRDDDHQNTVLARLKKIVSEVVVVDDLVRERIKGPL